MTATTERPDGTPDSPPPQDRSIDWAQLIVCAVLVFVGSFLIFDALTLAVDSPRSIRWAASSSPWSWVLASSSAR